MISPKVNIIEDLRKFLNESVANKERYTTHKNAFTKPKKLSFMLTVLFLLNLPRKSLGVEIEDFFQLLDMEEMTCTKSAISQARYKVKPILFIAWNRALQESYYKHKKESIKTFGPYQLQGVDGTTLHLMDLEEIRETFGYHRNQHRRISMARVVARVDVLNDLIIDGQLGPINKGEKEMAVVQLGEVSDNVISIYDRNFASFAFIYEHVRRNLHFIIRCKLGHNQAVKDFVSSGKKSAVVSFQPTVGAIKYFEKEDVKLSKQDDLKVRVVRVELNTGETEILITSLMDEQEFPAEVFGELYHLRWGTETCFDTLKNKLQITAFSGHTPTAIYQEFYATILVANINTLLIQDCEEEVEQISKGRKHDYKINKNVSIGLMKNDLVKLFIEENQKTFLQLLERMKTRFLRHIEPVRPQRAFKRKYKRRPRCKYYTLTNYRRAI